MRFSILLSCLISASLLTSTSAKEKPSAKKIGEKVDNSRSLRDLRGSRRSLHSFGGDRHLVLAFLGTDCPLSSVYVPTLNKLSDTYHKKGIQFLAIYPNDNEDFDAVAAHSYDRDIPFPVLKDLNQQLAHTVGVTRVPSVVILDTEFKLRYRGRIDDRYGVGFRRPKATRSDLEEAIKEIVASKKVSIAETEADGCLLDIAGKLPARKDVTYANQISRILQKRCQNCHRPNQAAPFSLLSYRDAVSHAKMLKEVTRQKRMPPWHADSRYGKFANDRSMPNEEINLLTAWVDSGMPFGEKKDLPKEMKFPEGWTLGKPDWILEMPEVYEVPAEGVVPYKHFTIEPDFKEDRWVQMAEARPGAAEVVHHVVVYILKPGQRRPFSSDGSMNILVGWAPGDLPLICPPGTALRIPKGSRLMFELHYTTVGKKVKDRSKIGVTFAKKPPEREIFINSFANESIQLPPREQHYRAEATLRLKADARIISLTPHMHWRGKSFYYEAILPNGETKTLLSVPRWDFNWQSTYLFEKPVKLPKGTKIHAVAHWDNSKNNPYNPDPTETVNFGLQTWDEMMVGWVTFVWEDPETPQKLAKEKVSRAELMFERFDRNGNDFVEVKEVPARLITILKFSGVKVPEKMDRKEFEAFFEEMMKRFRRSQQSQSQQNQKDK